ncbi:Enoyl-CoA hydratase [Pseudonocardia sp. Ae168_Ps1]|uniref:crotonase/enoyl-CoA hydratase family protein n=1 Tax=unclassified Pseudonocardia TaxID=2619320 RepID=UPI00094B3CD1|nr:MULTISPECIES: crotonase/enoyl-CoA hydratase family protein [unclassified Pseudonocardia]OLL73455.1 Enoyl-CoA hydratase [Pseudonocardia sp. Ae150A_Ps1]OLL79431.1 Enoyl-CoA hydratase [Pseudonocardia sp. Ae168_Ps1]OLL86434.1 Enoyl-CoA hydratase [Pseudonocardia sp. Ae263_Ps1]OLL93525.1 Enoyl-CoA hydratase [Pseudonocardia sp. Ae356_Ps1]
MSVRLDVADGVATLVLDRPEVRNAVDRPAAEAISAALDEIDVRPDVSVAVLTGAGGIFSAGMDLKAFAATKERSISEQRGGFGIVERPPAKPLIAAVEGKALGGGFEIALACDLIVAADDAWFGLPEVKRGLVAAAGGVLRLPRRIPRNVAMELVLTGAPITAGQGHDLGLVNRIAPAGEALKVARELAGEIAGNAPLALRAAKTLVDASADWPAEEAFTRQSPHTDLVRSSEDAAEGAKAFVEKRRPVWTGR